MATPAMRLPPDETIPAYRLMLALGLVGVIILAVGLAQFVTFEPPGQKTGQVARILGVYDYDPTTHSATGPPRDHFRIDQPFAAEVDWSSLPPAEIVGAAWFGGGFTIDFGGVGPAPAGTLVGHGLVPVNSGTARFPSGHYQFVVERYSGGRPVEVLARTTVLVVGS
jgi:hypothetical protein